MLTRSFLVLVIVLALLPQRGQANSYGVESLEKTPSPDEVFAFASAPPVPAPQQDPPLPPIKQLTRDDLLTFLREGIRPGPEFSPKHDTEDVWCTGVFFTRDGAAYYWRLWNRQTLDLITTDYRHCYLTLSTTSVQPRPVPRGPDEFRPLKPPAAMTFFTLPTPTDPQPASRFRASRRTLIAFFSVGRSFITPHFPSKSTF